jgi:hypothetical protein
MSNSTTQTIDLCNVAIEQSVCEDELLTLGGAATVKAGTILARDSSTGKLVIFVKGGSTNGNGVPKAVMTYETSADGAGDIPVRPLISGRVNRDRLVIHADGDDSNVDGAVADGLRAASIVPSHVSQLAFVPTSEDS